MAIAPSNLTRKNPVSESDNSSTSNAKEHAGHGSCLSDTAHQERSSQATFVDSAQESAVRGSLKNPYEHEINVPYVLKAVVSGTQFFGEDEVEIIHGSGQYAQVQLPEQAVTSAVIIEKLRQHIKAQKQEKSKSREAQEQEFESPLTSPGR